MDYPREAEMNLTPATTHILIEAEDFDDYGGWILDTQFEQQMGSPYLMAHGSGGISETAAFCSVYYFLFFLRGLMRLLVT